VALIPKRILLSVIEAADATVDSLHLTQQGHDEMAAAVWALLEPAIREAARQAEPGNGEAFVTKKGEPPALSPRVETRGGRLIETEEWLDFDRGRRAEREDHSIGDPPANAAA
jgi:hypothetical protein